MATKKDKVGVGDSLAVEALDGDGNPLPIAGAQEDEAFSLGYHDGRAWQVQQEDRGWYITAEDYGYATVGNQTFFDTEEEALQARVRLITLVGGTEA